MSLSHSVGVNIFNQFIEVNTMILMKKICFGAVLLVGMLASVNLLAEDTIDADEFVKKASAKGLAEIETSKLALKKSQSADVQKFAQTMIDDHTKANQELATIARNKKLDTSDDAKLMDKTKATVLKQREGESFEEAYANNQVKAHKQTISLFQKATNLQDAELRAFAQKTLPKLQHHLQMAQELQAATDTDKKSMREKGAGVGTGASASGRETDSNVNQR